MDIASSRSTPPADVGAAIRCLPLQPILKGAGKGKASSSIPDLVAYAPHFPIASASGYGSTVPIGAAGGARSGTAVPAATLAHLPSATPPHLALTTPAHFDNAAGGHGNRDAWWEPIDGLHGRVKSYSATKGFGFVECSYLKERGMKDAFLDADGIGSFKKGDGVIFSVRFNDKGQPQAHDLISPDNLQGRVKLVFPSYGFIECESLKRRGFNDVYVEKAQLASFQVGNVVSFSVRVNEKGQLQASGSLESIPNAAASASAAQVSQSQKDDLETKIFSGRIKSFNEQNGYGFIGCEELTNRGYGDVFLHKNQLGSFKVGSAVAFSVRFSGKHQLQASDLRPQNVEETPMLGGDQPENYSACFGKGGDDTDATDIAASSSTSPSQENSRLVDGYWGIIKSFSESNGYGFIDCDEIREEGLGDVFLHKSQLGSFKVGNLVTFSVRFSDKRQPQAFRLSASVWTESGTHSAADLGQSSSTEPFSNLEGIIKSFNGQKGYGFIECEYMRKHGLADVFLHKKQLGSFQIGQRIRFSVNFNEKGLPQATELKAANSVDEPSQFVKRHLNQKHLCVVCQENPIGIVYSVCGHGCLCRECSAEADLRIEDALDRCPVCRSPGARRQLYLS